MNGALPGTQTSAGSGCNQDVQFTRKSKKLTSGSAPDLNEVIGLVVSACIQPPVAPYFSKMAYRLCSWLDIPITQLFQIRFARTNIRQPHMEQKYMYKGNLLYPAASC